ncbi:MULTISPECIES: ribosomal L7Ae/L30e/S12e/Gadd45 family protein [Petrotoga]|uniref:Ribosomal protein L7Ae-like RNA K-turn-binding protein n=2 Tax=Petrotoga sibirica TaxID=156202 RepID=A0A4R8ELW2_9BACT|nr:MULTISPECIES: ribosomal L7Ae/L30e/S12e/Gadd45 family protein [Petrotoga]POZ89167.1 50S ribosomal protein L7ae [Petrotoga sibirica DSM 13575]POZ91471.1 50S ribosomal protein L7ae [Petrotoga sp. SL27]TDX12899.1 ribosomal protein L7Ae-like RNA K-turn-binding protein [Petrotoga sibirica]
MGNENSLREQKILSYTGFAAKANKIVYGKRGLRNYIRSFQRKKVILIPKDTGSRVKLDVIKHCQIFDVPYIELNYTKSDLAKTLGKQNISVVGITDENIIEGILKTIQ